jgi:hypothetical protein
MFVLVILPRLHYGTAYCFLTSSILLMAHAAAGVVCGCRW